MPSVFSKTLTTKSTKTKWFDGEKATVDGTDLTPEQVKILEDL